VLAYLNSKNRLNWGAALQRLVYPYPYYYIQEVEFAGEPALQETQDIYRIQNYDISAFGSYPLDSVRRVEGYLGFRYIDFSETLYTNLYSLVDGSLIFHEKTTINTQPSLNYSYVTFNYYYDTGIFGATSPILGQNYGISVSPAVGFGKNGLTFTTLALDFRKYVIPVRPFTVAFRALHYGRYGKNSEDDRLYPLYIAYWDLVRGYESFTSGEVTRAQEMGREPFDYNRLFGSKLIVANVELRFPVFGVLGLGKGYFGVWPLEFYGFYDWGVAYANQPGYWWGGAEATDVKPWFLGGNRYPLSSTGIGLRTNLFGAIVIGLNYVYPISRPERGWHFQLSLSPGF
jgi:outer membrane protein assembly factor BamA